MSSRAQSTPKPNLVLAADQVDVVRDLILVLPRLRVGHPVAEIEVAIHGELEGVRHGRVGVDADVLALKNSAPKRSVMIRLCATRSELTTVGPMTQSCPKLYWCAQLFSACVPVPAVSRFDAS